LRSDRDLQEKAVPQPGKFSATGDLFPKMWNSNDPVIVFQMENTLLQSDDWHKPGTIE